MPFLLLSLSANAQNVGIGQSNPVSKLDINGNLTVGSTYSGTSAAPANGAIIEGNVAIGKPSVSTSTTLDVNGFTRTGAITMGMDCSYEGTDGTEHNDFGCLICVVDPDDGNVYCRSTTNDQEELDDAASSTVPWTGWTNYGFPGPAGTYVQEIEVFIASTNSDDAGSGGTACDGDNDWAGAITIRLSNGDVYMRATTAVSGSTNSADACVHRIGGDPTRYTTWFNMGQP